MLQPTHAHACAQLLLTHCSVRRAPRVKDLIRVWLLHKRTVHACSSFMSVDADTKSSRLLIFFSLALRVTAALVYDSISLAGRAASSSSFEMLIGKGAGGSTAKKLAM